MQLVAANWLLAEICKEIVAGCQPIFSYLIHARLDLDRFCSTFQAK